MNTKQKMNIPDDEKRIMEIFKVKKYDKIPSRTHETMKIYHNYLKKKLVFQIVEKHTSETGSFKSKTIAVNTHNLSDL